MSDSGSSTSSTRESTQQCRTTAKVEEQMAALLALLKDPKQVAKQRATQPVAGLAAWAGSAFAAFGAAGNALQNVVGTLTGDKPSDEELASCPAEVMPAGEFGNSPTFSTATETLALGVGLLRQIASGIPVEDAMNPIRLATCAFEEGLRFARALPRPLATEDGKAVQCTPALQSSFSFFLRLISKKIKDLSPGGVLVLPGGWLKRSVSTNDVAAADDGGHCIFLVVSRNLTEADKFALSIVNTGEGIEYHPADIVGSAPHPSLATRQNALVFCDIPACRITSSSFWYLLYRQILYPSDQNGPSMTYGVLLPSVAQRPLSATFGAEPAGWTMQLPVPVAGDHSFGICLERTLHVTLAAAGLNPTAAAWYSSVALRQALVTCVNEALHEWLEMSGATNSCAAKICCTCDRALAHTAGVSLARAASEYASTFGEGPGSSDFQDIDALIDDLESCLSKLEGAESIVQSARPSPFTLTGANLETDFDEVDRLFPPDLHEAACEVEPPRILIPVLTCTLPQSIKDPFEAASCCRHVAELLTLLTNQQDQIPSAVPNRFALVVHLMARVLPMPLPLDHPEKSTKCFWMQPVKYETKANLMKTIYLITRHFAAVAFTLNGNREIDGARVCVAAALTAVMDCLSRTNLEYTPGTATQLTSHYSGSNSGPKHVFGLDPKVFEEVSETLLLVAPEYVTLRTLVLDYFRSVRRVVDDDHVIFQFDTSMDCSTGDRLLMEQVGLSLGVKGAKREAHLLITGERTDLAELYPELSWFRDVVFLWKMLLLPGGEGPPQKQWRAADSILSWSWAKDQYVVHGFGVNLSPNVKKKAQQGGGFLARLSHRLHRYNSDDKALSSASPSLLTDTDVRTEDDILFLKTLPDFNGALPPADVELLLTYLTAPYIRVPLILGFFTDRQRISLLREPSLQAVLDAALFEPGPWQSCEAAADGPPDTVPAPSRKHLTTPVGLLFNELLKCPDVVLNALLIMLRAALDKDNGQPGSGNEGLILYAIRFALRVESYILFLIQHIQKDTYLQELRYGASHEAKVRGLPGSESSLLNQLQNTHSMLREVLDEEVYGVLDNWIKRSIMKRDELLPVACRAQAHLAFLFKNVHPDNLKLDHVAVLLSSQAFLNANHRWFRSNNKGSETSEGSLGMRDFELVDLFEAKRCILFRWLHENPQDANEVMEKVERVVTLKGTVQQLLPGEVQQDTREWVELPEQPGNFVPNMEAPSPEWMAPQKDERFHPWLLRTTSGLPDTSAQISVNLGMYRTQTDEVKMLPEWALVSQEYEEAFGRKHVQCTSKEISIHCSCLEIVGYRHEIQQWTLHEQGVEADPFTSFKSSHPYRAANLRGSQQWLADVFEPVRLQVSPLNQAELYVQGSIPDGPDAVVRLACKTCRNLGGEAQKQAGQLKEIMVRRSPQLVEVYNVEEYGRQFYRSLVFSSDTAWSFYAPRNDARLLPNGLTSTWTLARGQAEDFQEPQRGVLIFRRISDKLDRQMYFPPRFLRGVLPDVLVDQYSFWRSKSQGVECLIGNERTPSDTPKRIYVLLRKTGKNSCAVIERRSLKVPLNVTQQDSALFEEDSSAPVEVLVNIHRMRGGLAQLLARVENASHILIWAHNEKQSSIQRVELPQMRLSFKNVEGRLMCEQHSGYFLCTKCPPGAGNLVAQWGGGTLLLESSSQEFMVIASAFAAPSRPEHWGVDLEASTKVLPSHLIFDKGAQSWASNLAEGSCHYHYPVHLSSTFTFTPTSAAGLYLLCCRMLTWHFAEVAAMASTVADFSTNEERQLWGHLKLLRNDSHADGIACRLHLILAMRPYGQDSSKVWNAKSSYVEYIRKRHLVSANCALSVAQELSLLKLPEIQELAVENVLVCERAKIVQHIMDNSTETPLLRLAAWKDDDGLERKVDRSVLDGMSILDKSASWFSGVKYSRPNAKLQGSAAVYYLDSLFGSSEANDVQIPFWLLYELFTGTIHVEVAGDDDQYVLATLLWRLSNKDGKKTLGNSVLSALAYEQNACVTMPKWGSEAASSMLGSGVWDTTDAAKLLRLAVENLKSKFEKDELHWPAEFNPPPRFPSQTQCKELKMDRLHALPITDDINGDFRVFVDHGENFGGSPLANIASSYVKMQPKQGQMTEAVRAALVGLQRDTRAQCLTGQQTLQRLLGELDYTDKLECSEPTLGQPSNLSSIIAGLHADLTSMKDADVEAGMKLMQEAVVLANKGSMGSLLQRKAGHLPRLMFSDVVRAFMAEPDKSLKGLQAVNSSLASEDADKLFDVVARTLCHLSRTSQLSRAQDALGKLDLELKKGGDDLAVKLKAQAVAQQLCASRHFTGRSEESDKIMVEPRLLVFEFLFDMLLYKSQVDIMNTFKEGIAKQKSVCHQMIMGAGKTTTIAPLLVLFLADGERLVTACMPHELLEMSRSVMTARFSSPVLPKLVLTLAFERYSPASTALLTKLEAARDRKAVLVAAPTSLKGILLKQLELLNILDGARRFKIQQQDLPQSAISQLIQNFGGARSASPFLTSDEISSMSQELHVCNRILKVFHRGAMLMDEVDLVLDPRKSELNWPLGVKRALDLTEGGSGRDAEKRLGLRYKFAIHLTDAIFVATGHKMASEYEDRNDAHEILNSLKQTVQRGAQQKRLQTMPHLLLLSHNFYESDLLPKLSEWAALFLQAHVEGILDDSELSIILREKGPLGEDLHQKLRGASNTFLKLMHLARSWLHILLPHVLSRVHRVSYGLLDGEQLRGAAPSRKYLAVPFIGKDRPSEQSEFQHPDVTIGFTIMAYRLSGMRRPDMKRMISVLIHDMKLENTVKHHRRRSCRKYVSMITNAGGTVRGFNEDGIWTEDLSYRDQQKRYTVTGSPSSSRKSGRKSVNELDQNLWPLEMLDLADVEQMTIIYEVLHNSPHAIKFLLEQYVFLPNSKIMDSNASQLTASGQELAGPQLFGLGLGFSGTPNNLLPKAMGECMFAQGDDGAILASLSNPDIVSVSMLSSWSPTSILDKIAAERTADGSRPRYHALIDTGALITGMTNIEVARYLLGNKGLLGLNGVVFLNEKDEQVVMLRDGMRIAKLAQCGLGWDQRFTFYDHVHTTGMDIKQPLSCTACVTLSKDMTFRDYAQGAYRMRGIGKGQKIELLLIPEVVSLVNVSLGQVGGITEEEQAANTSKLDKGSTAWNQKMAVDVIEWLVLNGICTDERKHVVLCGQSLRNVWKQAASTVLEEAPSSDVLSWLSIASSSLALNVLRNRVDTDVPSDLPGDDVLSLAHKLGRELVENVKGTELTPTDSLWPDKDVKRKALELGWTIIHELKAATDVKFDSGEGGQEIQGEQVQEQEQEQENEQEQEQEQRQEQEQEQERENVPQAPAALKYSRADERPRPWQLSCLTGDVASVPFYTMSRFTVGKGVIGTSSKPLTGIPEYVLLSENYFHREWISVSARRLKNVICFLEWVPKISEIKELHAHLNLTPEQCANIAEAFSFYDVDRSGEISGEELMLLFKDLDMDDEAKELLSQTGSTSFTLDQIQEELTSQRIYHMQEGRYFVGLSLEEAEHLRGCMHLMGAHDSRFDSSYFALRSITNRESVLNNSLLDTYGKPPEGKVHQLHTVEELLRFLNCSEGFQHRDLNILLRALHPTDKGNRLPWWLDVRSCRRRAQTPYEQLPIARVFITASEFDSIKVKALVSRLRWALVKLRMSPADAFRKINTLQTGTLTKAELQNGLEWLRINEALPKERWSQTIDEVHKLMDVTGNGTIDVEEFKATLEMNDIDWDSVPAAMRLKIVDAPQTDAPTPTATGIAAKMDFTPTLARVRSHGRFQMRWYDHTELGQVWSTHGTLAEKPLAIWEPLNLGAHGSGIFSNIYEAIPLGHVLRPDFQQPASVPVLEVDDIQESGVFASHSREDLARFVELFFPHPIRFRQAWTLMPSIAAKTKVEPLYIWQPVPPTENFFAAGVVATTTDVEPSTDLIRCIPRVWTTEIPRASKVQRWNDTGMGGSRATFWSSQDEPLPALFSISTGTEAQIPPPMSSMRKDTFYSELPAEKEEHQEEIEEVDMDDYWRH